MLESQMIPEHNIYFSAYGIKSGDAHDGGEQRFNSSGLRCQTALPGTGNGALMRIAPVVLPHLKSPSSALWDDAVLAGAVTHNDVTSIAACVAFAGMLWELLDMAAAPQPAWWLDALWRGCACSKGRCSSGPGIPAWRSAARCGDLSTPRCGKPSHNS
jgi:hypothetical protein